MNANNAYYLNFCVQAPVECFTSLVLTFFKHFVYLSFLLFSVFLGFLFITEWQHWLDYNLYRDNY